MDNLVADFTININEPLQAEFVLGNSQTFDCSFELFAAGTVWGSIDGDITNQTDLQNALNLKADRTDLDADVELINQTINENYNDLSGQIEDLETVVADNYTALENDLTSLSTTVDNNYSELSNRLLNDEQTTSDLIETVADNYTELNGKISVNTGNITSIQNTINSYGNIVSYNATDFATASQGALADKALQSGDNITELVNNAGYITGINSADVTNALGYTPYNSSNPAGYITSADLPTLEDLTTQAQMDAINSGATSVNIAQIASNTQTISTETLNRQNADNGLQSQIDAIVASSDVFDIVGTYAELQAYDISTVPPNDIIKVLVDSTHNNAATYYRCIETNSVKSWSYIGSEGAYYTKSEADGRFVPLTRTINGKALSNNITLDATDVGALPSSTVIPTVNNGTLTIQVNGTSVGTFTANQSGNTTANIVVPDSATWGNITGDIEDQTDLQTALDDKQDKLTAGTDLEIIAGSNNTVINFTNESGYITGINSTDVTTALGYTPVNPSSLATVATSGDYDDLTNKPTIPTVGDGTITITQGGVTKGTFTTNQSGNSTIALDAGGGGTGVFVAQYDVTTFAEVQAAINAGEIVTVSYAYDTYFLNSAIMADETTVSGYVFISQYPVTSVIQYLTLDSEDEWSIRLSLSVVTTTTAQNISGRKTFLGEKAIYFKQSATTDKLGFTLYNPSNTELGAFEWRPSTIGGGALLNINVPYSSSNYVGFRYWGTAVNIIAPKVGTAGDYYIPVNITDGNTTVTANSSGTVNISSLLPNVSGYLENTATGSNSLSIFGSDATYNDAINIGYNSNAIGSHSVTIGCESHDAYYPEAGNFSVAIGNGAIAETNSVAIGYEAQCYYNTNNSIAIGNQASVSKSGNNTTTYAIQLGEGENTTSNTMQVWNYPLLDKTTGLIPDARLSSNIARTSQIPTVPTNISAFTNDSGYVTSSALSGYATQTWVGQQGFVTSASLPTMTYTSATETLVFG